MRDHISGYIKVLGFVEDSCCKGLLQPGDIIRTMDGVKLKTVEAVRMQCGGKTNSVLEIVYTRGGGRPDKLYFKRINNKHTGQYELIPWDSDGRSVASSVGSSARSVSALHDSAFIGGQGLQGSGRTPSGHTPSDSGRTPSGHSTHDNTGSYNSNQGGRGMYGSDRPVDHRSLRAQHQAAMNQHPGPGGRAPSGGFTQQIGDMRHGNGMVQHPGIVGKSSGTTTMPPSTNHGARPQQKAPANPMKQALTAQVHTAHGQPQQSPYVGPYVNPDQARGPIQQARGPVAAARPQSQPGMAPYGNMAQQARGPVAAARPQSQPGMAPYGNMAQQGIPPQQTCDSHLTMPQQAARPSSGFGQPHAPGMFRR